MFQSTIWQRLFQRVLDTFLERVKQDLERGRLLDLPGGIVLIGGGAIMPGIVEVSTRDIRY